MPQKQNIFTQAIDAFFGFLSTGYDRVDMAVKWVVRLAILVLIISVAGGYLVQAVESTAGKAGDVIEVVVSEADAAVMKVTSNDKITDEGNVGSGTTDDGDLFEEVQEASSADVPIVAEPEAGG